MMQAGSKQLEEGRRDHELKTKGLLAARTLEVVVIAAWIEQGVFLDFFFWIYSLMSTSTCAAWAFHT
jgi:hypothetical protein